MTSKPKSPAVFPIAEYEAEADNMAAEVPGDGADWATEALTQFCAMLSRQFLIPQDDVIIAATVPAEYRDGGVAGTLVWGDDVLNVSVHGDPGEADRTARLLIPARV